MGVELPDDVCVSFLHPKVGSTSVAIGREAPLVLGRSGASADLSLDWDPRVSRRHAQIVVRADGVWFEDLGSRNGSWLGDVRITTPIKMQYDMEIIVGETVVSLDDRRTRKRPLPVLSRGLGRVSTADLRDDAPVPAVPETADLPQFTAEQLSPPVPASRRLRATPRFVEEKVIELRVTGPEGLAELWERELSRGILFVPTGEMRSAGAKVEVRFISPQGSLHVAGSVEWRIGSQTAAKTNRPMGLGLSLHMGSEERRALREYAEGLAARLSGAPSDAPSAEDRGAVADELVALASAGDLYGALGLAPIAATLEVRARIGSLRALFSGDAERFAAALGALSTLEATLGDEAKRLAYDLKNGHVRAEERIALAKNSLGPSLLTLRQAWEQAFPAQADRAAFLSRTAFQHRAKGRHAEAIEAAKSALELHPFFDELRATIRQWSDPRASRR